MWLYFGLMDPDRASLVELAKDKVWSQLDRVLQLKARRPLKESPDLSTSRSYPIWYVLLSLFYVPFDLSLL